MCVLCMQCPQRSEEGVESPGTAFVDGCEPPCRSWDSNSVREAGALCGGSLSCPWKFYFSSVWSEVQLKSGEKRHWEQWTACTMLPSRSLEPGGKEQNIAQFSISPVSSEMGTKGRSSCLPWRSVLSMSTQELSVKLKPNISQAPGAWDRTRSCPSFTEEGWMWGSEFLRCPQNISSLCLAYMLLQRDLMMAPFIGTLR